MAQRKVYYIPDNFVDDEKIFGGKFRKRNFIEAVIFTLPVLGLFWLINWATGIGWGTLFYPTFLFGIATFFLFIIGYNGDSWGETLLLAQKFRSNKFNISTYNPRVKTELTADYLANPKSYWLVWDCDGYTLAAECYDQFDGKETQQETSVTSIYVFPDANESYISHIDADSIVDGYVGSGSAPLCLSGIKNGQ